MKIKFKLYLLTAISGFLLNVINATAQCNISVGRPDTTIVCGEQVQLTVESEWLPVSSGVSTALNDIKFITAAIGYACGNNGVLFKTTNGGAVFNRIILPTVQNLKSVYFLSADTGFVMGDSAILYGTTNGGATWSFINTGASSSLGFTAIHFINTHTGYLAASGSLILKTVNRGQTWTAISTSGIGDITDVYFADTLTGYVSTTNNVYKTINGGASWNAIAYTFPMHDLLFLNKDTGFVAGTAGNSFVVKTVNGGNTWDVVFNEMYAPRKLELAGANTLYGFGKGVWKSSDFGKSWSVAVSAPESEFNSNNLFFYAGTVGNSFGGIGVGSFGKIFRNQLIDSVMWSPGIGLNDSTSVNPLASPGETIQYTVTARTESCITSGFKSVIVKPLKISGQNRILFSCGDTLSVVSVINSNQLNRYTYNWSPSAFVIGSTNQSVLSVSPDSTINYNLHVSAVNGCQAKDTFRITSDFNFNLTPSYTVKCGNQVIPQIDTNIWNLYDHSTAQNFNKIQFVSKDTGFVLGSKTIYRSSDGGLKWGQNLLDSSQTVVNMEFRNSRLGFALSNNFGVPAILKTSDGGLTWSSYNAQSLVSSGFYPHNHMSFPSDNIGYIICNDATTSKLLKTQNGGQTWTSSTVTYHFTAMQFVNTMVGYASSYSGTNSLLKTTNGGLSWSPVSVPFTTSITSMFFKSADTGYVVTGRFVYKTYNGGQSWRVSQFEKNTDLSVFESKIYYTVAGKGYMLTSYNSSGNLNAKTAIYETNGNDSTWSRVSADSMYRMNDMHSVSNGKPVAAGDSGYFMKPAKSPVWYSWTPSAGLSNPNIPSPVIQTRVSRTYHLTAGNANCSKTKSMLVDVIPYSIDLQSSDTFTCGDSVKIIPGNVKFSITASSNGSKWEILDSIGNIVFRSEPEKTFSGKYYLAQGNYTFRCVPTVIPPPLNIKIIPDEGDSINEIIYWTNDTLIQRYFTVGDMSNYMYSWSPSLTRISPALVSGFYTLTLTNSNGCTALDSILIVPQQLKVNAGEDRSIVCGNMIRLDTIRFNTSSDENINFSWVGNSFIDDTLSLSPIVFPNISSRFVVNAYTDNGCKATDTVEVDINPLWVQAIDTSFYCNDTGTIRTATNYSGEQQLLYQWLPVENIDSANSKWPVIYARENKKYLVTVSTWNGCSVSDSVFISLMSPPSPEICIVGVNDQNRNQIVWNKPWGRNIDSFFVWRETNVTNQYSIIGYVNSTQSYLFIDTNSAPNVQSNRYKLSYVDQCKMQSSESNQHQTMHLTINKGTGSTWNLIWNKYEGFTVNTYNVYRGSQINNMALIGSSSGSNNSYTDVTAPEGDVFYMVEIVSPFTCNPGKSFNTSRSNKASNTLLSLKPSNSGNRFTLFPNPATDLIMLYFEVADKYDIKIFDTQGRVLHEQTISQTKVTIPVVNFAPGLYYISISGNESEFKGSFIRN